MEEKLYILEVIENKLKEEEQKNAIDVEKFESAIRKLHIKWKEALEYFNTPREEWEEFMNFFNKKNNKNSTCLGQILEEALAYDKKHSKTSK